jgi:hypothetical protein
MSENPCPKVRQLVRCLEIVRRELEPATHNESKEVFVAAKNAARFVNTFMERMA